MENKDTAWSPEWKLCVNGCPVTVTFRDQESADIKGKVRDILTEVYLERFEKEMASCRLA